MRSTGDQLLKEKGGLSLSVVKSLVCREKEERLSFEFVGDEEKHSLMSSLFKLEEQFSHGGGQWNPELLHSTSLCKNLHGAPPGSFVHQLAEIIGSISSVHKMVFFWQSVVPVLRKLWKKRRKTAKESLDSLLKQHWYYVLRLGADCLSENLTLLETSEPIYSPILQEGPIMTAELIKETEELVLQTGSLGAGCSQLLSDMQALKAANPGCVLEDFVRWHSPPDWSEDCAASSTSVGQGSSRLGRLSDRMQTKEGICGRSCGRLQNLYLLLNRLLYMMKI